MQTLEGAWPRVCTRALPFLTDVAIRAVQFSTSRATVASRQFGVVAKDCQFLVAQGCMTKLAGPFKPALAHQMIPPTRPWLARSIDLGELVDFYLGLFLYEEINTLAVLVDWNVTSDRVFVYRETAYNTGLLIHSLAWQSLSRIVHTSSLGTSACLIACQFERHS